MDFITLFIEYNEWMNLFSGLPARLSLDVEFWRILKMETDTNKGVTVNIGVVANRMDSSVGLFSILF